MTKPKSPKSLEEATPLLERYAHLGGAVALIEATRSDALAWANAAADKDAAPLLAEQATIAAQLEPWWKKAAPTLTKGNRKSMAIGGCKIGTKQGNVSLELAGGDWDSAALAMKGLRWAKNYFRVKPAVEKAATLKALDEKPHGEKLAALGFSKKPGAESFFVEPVAQAGTVTEAAKG